jgi:hypothetical protein
MDVKMVAQLWATLGFVLSSGNITLEVKWQVKHVIEQPALAVWWASSLGFWLHRLEMHVSCLLRSSGTRTIVLPLVYQNQSSAALWVSRLNFWWRFFLASCKFYLCPMEDICLHLFYPFCFNSSSVNTSEHKPARQWFDSGLWWHCASGMLTWTKFYHFWTQNRLGCVYRIPQAFKTEILDLYGQNKIIILYFDGAIR